MSNENLIEIPPSPEDIANASLLREIIDAPSSDIIINDNVGTGLAEEAEYKGHKIYIEAHPYGKGESEANPDDSGESYDAFVDGKLLPSNTMSQQELKNVFDKLQKI